MSCQHTNFTQTFKCLFCCFGFFYNIFNRVDNLIASVKNQVPYPNITWRREDGRPIYRDVRKSNGMMGLGAGLR